MSEDDCFTPATTVLVVATKVRDRWFDLDAVRTPMTPEALEHERKYHAGGKRRTTYGSKTGAEAMSSAMGNGGSNPAGAPPLDWWLAHDDDQQQRPEGQPVAHATYHVGDVFDIMATLEDGSVDLVLTSPPFTGRTRGLLCSNCNQALGKVKESTTTLANMIAYVEDDPLLGVVIAALLAAKR